MRVRTITRLLPVLLSAACLGTGLAGIGFGAASAAPAADAAARKAIEAQLAVICAALKKKDVAAMMAVLTADYTSKDTSGKVTARAKYAENAANSMKTAKSVEAMTDTITSFKVAGEKATTEEIEKITLIVVDADGAIGTKGKSHKLEMVSPVRHVWMKTNGKWLIKQAEDMPGGKQFVDGQPIAPSEPPKL